MTTDNRANGKAGDRRNGQDDIYGGTAGVPFLDLLAPHRQLEEVLASVFKEALMTAGFIGGPMVETFEKDFAHYCDTEYCIGVASGTDALRFALLAAGVKAGDAVVTVPNTFIATTEAISQAGAHPEFVDVELDTHNMDADRLCEFIETKCDIDATTGQPVTKRGNRTVTAIVPVHLYGHPSDMDAILELAERRHLTVIEDACQAHGAEYFSRNQGRWAKVGSLGRAAAFSFYPGKNLGACGEAGAVTTNDEGLARKIRMLRDHGQSRKYHHEIEGYNGRLDAIQAGILGAKLRYLDQWNRERRSRAELYDKLLSACGASVILPNVAAWAKAIFHLYVIRVEHREEFIAHLASCNIGTGIHYPVPLHLQNAYKHLGYKEGDFPVSEGLAKQVVSLPMYPSLAEEQQAVVCEQIRHFLTRDLSDQESRPALVAS